MYTKTTTINDDDDLSSLSSLSDIFSNTSNADLEGGAAPKYYIVSSGRFKSTRVFPISGVTGKALREQIAQQHLSDAPLPPRVAIPLLDQILHFKPKDKKSLQQLWGRNARKCMKEGGLFNGWDTIGNGGEFRWEVKLAELKRAPEKSRDSSYGKLKSMVEKGQLLWRCLFEKIQVTQLEDVATELFNAKFVLFLLRTPDFDNVDKNELIKVLDCHLNGNDDDDEVGCDDDDNSANFTGGFARGLIGGGEIGDGLIGGGEVKNGLMGGEGVSRKYYIVSSGRFLSTRVNEITGNKLKTKIKNRHLSNAPLPLTHALSMVESISADHLSEIKTLWRKTACAQFQNGGVYKGWETIGNGGAFRWEIKLSELKKGKEKIPNSSYHKMKLMVDKSQLLWQCLYEKIQATHGHQLCTEIFGRDFVDILSTSPDLATVDIDTLDEILCNNLDDIERGRSKNIRSSEDSGSRKKTSKSEDGRRNRRGSSEDSNYESRGRNRDRGVGGNLTKRGRSVDDPPKRDRSVEESRNEPRTKNVNPVKIVAKKTTAATAAAATGSAAGSAAATTAATGSAATTGSATALKKLSLMLEELKKKHQKARQTYDKTNAEKHDTDEKLFKSTKNLKKVTTNMQYLRSTGNTSEKMLKALQSHQTAWDTLNGIVEKNKTKDNQARVAFIRAIENKDILELKINKVEANIGAQVEQNKYNSKTETERKDDTHKYLTDNSSYKIKKSQDPIYTTIDQITNQIMTNVKTNKITDEEKNLLSNFSIIDSEKNAFQACFNISKMVIRRNILLNSKIINAYGISSTGAYYYAASRRNETFKNAVTIAINEYNSKNYDKSVTAELIETIDTNTYQKLQENLSPTFKNKFDKNTVDKTIIIFKQNSIIIGLLILKPFIPNSDLILHKLFNNINLQTPITDVENGRIKKFINRHMPDYVFDEIISKQEIFNQIIKKMEILYQQNTSLIKFTENEFASAYNQLLHKPFFKIPILQVVHMITKINPTNLLSLIGIYGHIGAIIRQIPRMDGHMADYICENYNLGFVPIQLQLDNFESNMMYMITTPLVLNTISKISDLPLPSPPLTKTVSNRRRLTRFRDESDTETESPYKSESVVRSKRIRTRRVIIHDDASSTTASPSPVVSSPDVSPLPAAKEKEYKTKNADRIKSMQRMQITRATATAEAKARAKAEAEAKAKAAEEKVKQAKARGDAQKKAATTASLPDTQPLLSAEVEGPDVTPLPKESDQSTLKAAKQSQYKKFRAIKKTNYYNADEQAIKAFASQANQAAKRRTEKSNKLFAHATEKIGRQITEKAGAGDSGASGAGASGKGNAQEKAATNAEATASLPAASPPLSASKDNSNKKNKKKVMRKKQSTRSKSLPENIFKQRSITEEQCKNPQDLLLKNQGNTCYMNAGIQLLYQIDEIRNYICNLELSLDNDVMLIALQSIFDNHKIINPIDMKTILKYSIKFNNSKAGKSEMIMGHSADTSSFLLFIFEYILASNVYTSFLGYKSNESYEIIVQNSHPNIKYINDKTDYTIYPKVTTTKYKRKIKSDLFQILKTIYDKDKLQTMQNLIDIQLKQRDAISDIRIATNENDIPKPKKLIKIDVPGVQITKLSNFKKWIIILVQRGNYDGIHTQSIQNVKNDINMDTQTYELVGSIRHSGAHYYYHKKMDNNNWITFNDNNKSSYEDRSLSIDKSYVFLYKQRGAAPAAHAPASAAPASASSASPAPSAHVQLQTAPTWSTVQNKSWYKTSTAYFKDLERRRVEKIETNQTSSVNGRVIALGDIHGDIDTLFMALYTARVIGVNAEWIGGNTTVVQLGDQIDRKRYSNFTDTTRCPELEVLQYTEYLHTEAKKSNGNFFSLLGNHEIYSTSSNARKNRYDFYFNYASEADLACFDRPKLFEPGKGLIASKVFAVRPVVIQIEKFVFSHADVGMFAVSDTHFEFAKSAKSLGVWSRSSLSFVPDTQQYTLEQLNNYVFDYMTCESSPTPNEPQNLDLFKINDAGTRKHIATYTPKIQTIIGIDKEMKGPLWERKICEDPFQSDSITSLNRNVTLKFVAGHSIQQTTSSINNTIRDNVWCVDTGMSEAFNGTGKQPYSREERAQSLEIINLNSESPSIRNIRYSKP